MRTKLTRVDGAVALMLDEPLLEQLGIADDAEVELSVSGKGLLVMPLQEAEVERRFRESAEKIAAKHAGLFRRLSK